MYPNSNSINVFAYWTFISFQCNQKKESEIKKLVCYPNSWELAISELPCASVPERVLRSHSYKNTWRDVPPRFILVHANELLFIWKILCEDSFWRRTRIESHKKPVILCGPRDCYRFPANNTSKLTTSFASKSQWYLSPEFIINPFLNDSLISDFHSKHLLLRTSDGHLFLFMTNKTKVRFLLIISHVTVPLTVSRVNLCKIFRHVNLMLFSHFSQNT